MSLFKNNDDALDRALADIQGEEIDPVVAEQAAARVWERLSAQASGAAELHASAEPVAEPAAVSAGSLRGCEDFQALIPAYLRGELSPARALLVEDHTRSCVPCRRALREAKEGHREAARPAAAKARVVSHPRMRQAWMGLAALLVIGLGFGLFVAFQEIFAGGDRMARVESIAGNLYRLDGEDSEAIGAGTWVAEGDEIRTAKGSTAMVRMADGSLIEMSDRSGMWLDAGRKGNTIHLDRGRIIVQAAKQRQKHLYVATRDALVSVTGTIFSVNHGTKGSRVSVIEGEVRVRQAKLDSILHPGNQVTTHASVAAIPVRQEIAWSRNAQKYDELLALLTAAGQDIDAQVERPGLRYSTRLLDLAPEGTRVWIGLPNLGQNLQETQRILDQKLAENQTLAQWWRETIGSNDKNEKFHQMIDKLGALGQHLGDEVAIALGPKYGEGEHEEEGEPVLMAEVTNPAAFRAVLEQEVAQHNNGHQSLRIIDNPAAATGEIEGAWLWIGQGLFVATPSGDELRAVAAAAAGGANPFASSRFHNRVAEEYRDGAGWVFGADLASLVEHEASQDDEHEYAEKAGLLDLDHFILNRREIDRKAETRASLTFDQPRRGVASWLAAPAPMGGLSFFSPEATLAAAFVVKQPVGLLDDLLAINPEMAAELEKLRTEHGFDVRNDLAAPLGGEVVMGVDGPVLPTPSWKLVAEVYDTARLQHTFEQIVARLNDELRKNGKPTVAITEQRSGGRTWYTFGMKEPKHELSYIFEDGYLVAAPSRALLEQALQLRESGVTLATAPKFRDLLGPDGQVNVSAFFYQNLKPVADAAANVLPKDALGPADNQGRIANFLLGQGPTLVYAYAEQDRILFASTNESPLGLNLQTLAGLGGVVGMMNGHGPDADAQEAE